MLCLRAAVSVLVWSLAVRLTALFLHSVVVILLEQINDDDDDDDDNVAARLSAVLLRHRTTYLVHFT